ncbi:hypothetical protein IMX26_13265 [Clostridium sp. 'deep sea']|uniref:hypothetical protein n=1 Tax=Clostridium sp. 'deep sea' TaxID=2779445 RepID=UPI001896A468|nr:hypothetical protein [Clostridium sp. 'deep sea']QOR34450.1 hypothetical protein IMX26_13265 [Clostridium sp. 'deep sea']
MNTLVPKMVSISLELSDIDLKSIEKCISKLKEEYGFESVELNEDNIVMEKGSPVSKVAITKEKMQFLIFLYYINDDKDNDKLILVSKFLETINYKIESAQFSSLNKIELVYFDELENLTGFDNHKYFDEINKLTITINGKNNNNDLKTEIGIGESYVFYSISNKLKKSLQDRNELNSLLISKKELLNEEFNKLWNGNIQKFISSF